MIIQYLLSARIEEKQTPAEPDCSPSAANSVLGERAQDELLGRNGTTYIMHEPRTTTSGNFADNYFIVYLSRRISNPFSNQSKYVALIR